MSKSAHKQGREFKERQRVPTDEEVDAAVINDRAEHHARLFPDGCSEWCEACKARLMCKASRHEWPRDYSDGDTCYCGMVYLIANSVDQRPHVIVGQKRSD